MTDEEKKGMAEANKQSAIKLAYGWAETVMGGSNDIAILAELVETALNDVAAEVIDEQGYVPLGFVAENYFESAMETINGATGGEYGKYDTEMIDLVRTMVFHIDTLMKARVEARNNIIEECALAVEPKKMGSEVAAFIRRLKSSGG